MTPERGAAPPITDHTYRAPFDYAERRGTDRCIYLIRGHECGWTENRHVAAPSMTERAASRPSPDAAGDQTCPLCGCTAAVLNDDRLAAHPDSPEPAKRGPTLRCSTIGPDWYCDLPAGHDGAHREVSKTVPRPGHLHAGAAHPDSPQDLTVGYYEPAAVRLREDVFRRAGVAFTAAHPDSGAEPTIEHVYLAAGTRPDGFYLSAATCSCGGWQWDFDTQHADSTAAREDWSRHVGGVGDSGAEVAALISGINSALNSQTTYQGLTSRLMALLTDEGLPAAAREHDERVVAAFLDDPATRERLDVAYHRFVYRPLPYRVTAGWYGDESRIESAKAADAILASIRPGAGSES